MKTPLGNAARFAAVKNTLANKSKMGKAPALAAAVASRKRGKK